MPHWILNKRADNHQTFCEDAYFYTERDGWVIAGVFDGCSTGVNSHFASQLHANIFRKIIDSEWTGFNQLFQTGANSDDELMDALTSSLGMDVKRFKEALGLTELEVLSTALLGLYNTKTKRLVVRYIGDGSVCVDGDIYRQSSGPDNAPTYIAYLDEEELDIDVVGEYYRTDIYADVSSFALCSDGIDAIVGPWDRSKTTDLLLRDLSLRESDAMLRRYANMIHKAGCVFQDDLTIIKYEAI